MLNRVVLIILIISIYRHVWLGCLPQFKTLRKPDLYFNVLLLFHNPLNSDLSFGLFCLDSCIPLFF
jgi:hypothetical protein